MVCCRLSQIKRIYCSHTLSSWGDRMWSFSLGLYLYNDSLQLTAIYGFSSCVSIIIFGALIGRWIDKTQRIKVARISLAVQNLGVILCAGLLILREFFEQKGYVELFLLIIIIILAVVSELASLANKIALQKDWVCVLAEGNETKLAKINSTMRTIDLTTYIMAPVAVGQVITFGSRISGAAFIAIWNVISWIVEFYLLSQICRLVPALTKRKEPLKPEESPDENANEVITSSAQVKSGCCGPLGRWASQTSKAFSEYFEHPVKCAGLALAFLYMSVICFDNVTSGYLYGEGISESSIGIFTAFGAFFGILGSLSFPLIRRKLGKAKSGIFGISTEALALILCVVSVFSKGSPFNPNAIFGKNVSIIPYTPYESNGNSTVDFNRPSDLFRNHLSEMLLLIGMILSRFGLWVGDLSVSLIFQEEVAEHKRGVLNGVQDSLNQLMSLLKFLLVIIYPSKETFGHLAILSWLFVCLGVIFISKYAYNERRRRRREGLSLISPRRNYIEASKGSSISRSSLSIRMDLNRNISQTKIMEFRAKSIYPELDSSLVQSTGLDGIINGVHPS